MIATSSTQMANGGVIVGGTAGGLPFLGVPLRLDFVDAVRRRSGSASMLHGQILDQWRLLEYGQPATRWSTPVEHGQRGKAGLKPRLGWLLRSAAFSLSRVPSSSRDTCAQ
jgi:hypothetical protein